MPFNIKQLVASRPLANNRDVFHYSKLHCSRLILPEEADLFGQLMAQPAQPGSSTTAIAIVPVAGKSAKEPMDDSTADDFKSGLEVGLQVCNLSRSHSLSLTDSKRMIGGSERCHSDDSLITCHEATN